MKSIKSETVEDLRKFIGDEAIKEYVTSGGSITIEGWLKLMELQQGLHVRNR